LAAAVPVSTSKTSEPPMAAARRPRQAAVLFGVRHGTGQRVLLVDITASRLLAASADVNDFRSAPPTAAAPAPADDLESG